LAKENIFGFGKALEAAGFCRIVVDVVQDSTGNIMSKKTTGQLDQSRDAIMPPRDRRDPRSSARPASAKAPRPN
jgi:hypothetical protein